jgi:hypothetical protein
MGNQMVERADYLECQLEQRIRLHQSAEAERVVESSIIRVLDVQLRNITKLEIGGFIHLMLENSVPDKTRPHRSVPGNLKDQPRHYLYLT